MCFSPVGDLVGGAVVVAIGVDACRHVKGRSENLAIAVLPLLLGLHQIDETFVWWGLQGHVPANVGNAATWVYLVFALVALPVIVPLMLVVFEPQRGRRWRYLPFLVLGLMVAGVIIHAMLAGAPSARLGRFHISYSVGLQHGIIVIGLYIVATCGSLLVSRNRSLRWFGVANVVGVVALAVLCANGFTSLWCFYAALVSGAIAVHLRLESPSDAERATSRAARATS